MERYARLDSFDKSYWTPRIRSGDSVCMSDLCRQRRVILCLLRFWLVEAD